MTQPRHGCDKPILQFRANFAIDVKPLLSIVESGDDASDEKSMRITRKVPTKLFVRLEVDLMGGARTVLPATFATTRDRLPFFSCLRSSIRKRVASDHCPRLTIGVPSLGVLALTPSSLLPDRQGGAIPRNVSNVLCRELRAVIRSWPEIEVHYRLCDESHRGPSLAKQR
jgi:hypothetical protein